MFAITRTLLQLRDAALSNSDKDSDDMVSTGQVNAWLNEGLRSLWMRLVPIARDELLKTQNFTISAPGNTHTPSALFDFFAVRGIGVNYGSGKYTRLRPYRFGRRGSVGRLTYRVSGMDSVGALIEIQPAELASVWPLQLLYVKNPSVKVNGGPTISHILVNNDDTIALPFSGDVYVQEYAAARARVRAEEDPTPHLAMLKMAWEEVRGALAAGSQGSAAYPDDWCDDDNDGGDWA